MSTKKGRKQPGPDPESSPKKTRNLREAIVLAALEVFCKEGVAKAKAAHIAKAAKVDPPLIAYYFGDLEDLFFEVVLVLLEDIKRAAVRWEVPVTAPIDFAMLRYLQGIFDWAEKNPQKFALSMYFYHLASFQPKFRLMNVKIRDVGRARISAMIYKGIVKGVFQSPAEGSVEDLALNIQGFMTGQVILLCTEDPTRLPGLKDRTIETIFRWLGTKVPVEPPA